jgi:hypothetical protein
MPGAPLVHARTDLLKQQRIAVDAEGELVTLVLGNVAVKMGYETALTLSQWLRVQAKRAKRHAGDNSRHWSVIGTLHNATPDEFAKTFNIRRPT